MGKIPMVKAAGEVFETDDPPGTFIIHFQDEYNKGFLNFICHKGNACGVHICKEPREKKEGSTINYWQWDGNLDQPTLTPSINCRACWHGFIEGGVLRTHGE